jgi:hypothetical protein
MRPFPRLKVSRNATLLDMKTRLVIFSVAVCVFLLGVTESRAQSPGYFGVEGQITDASSGRPLSGARVTLRQTRPSDGLVVRATTVMTDATGFYVFEELQLTETYPTVEVACLTPKREVITTLPLYSTLREQRVYVRNAALTLPRRVSRCTLPTPASN